MIRENQRLFNVINVIIDVIILLISNMIVNSHLFDKVLLLGNVTNIFAVSRLNTILLFFALLIISYIFLYSFFGLYKPQRTNKTVFSESSNILKANIAEFLFLSFLISFGLLPVTLDYIISFTVINFIIASIERATLRGVLRLLRSKGFNTKYILIIGAGEVGQNVVSTIKLNTYLGYKVIGFLDDNMEGELDGIPVLGKLDDLERILSEKMVDRVIVSVAPRHYKVLEKLMRTCEKMGVRADIVPDYYRYITAHPSIELIDNIPLISVRFLPLDITYNDLFKRICDILFVVITGIIISPLLLVVALAIKLTSPGNIIYKQERIGKGGVPFQIYKFRSMSSENEYIDDKKWTQKDDPRITKVGRFIRKTSIDELPQFYNILKGDMSLIGPRPERPYFVNKFREDVPKYMIKHHVRPGMTGWAQVNGYRGNTSIVKRIEYDIYYVENWTFLLDLKIFFKTIPTLINDKNAY